MLAVPMQGQQVHPQLRIYAIKVQLPLLEVQCFQLPFVIAMLESTIGFCNGGKAQRLTLISGLSHQLLLNGLHRTGAIGQLA